MASRYKHKTIKYKKYREHQLIVGEIPEEAVIHHVDGDGTNNSRDNLVVCQDRAYHWLIHSRAKAYDTTGDANKRRCYKCKAWFDTKDMIHMRPPRQPQLCRPCGR